MPDYNLYDKWLSNVDGAYRYFKDYSIGFTTRGCFRHCAFCVNRRSNKVVAHSPLAEFLDPKRKKICLLDDNFFGFDGWRNILLDLINTNKPFQFKQGLDVRLLDDYKADLLFRAKYDGDFIFAFDDWNDATLIRDKLHLIRRHYSAKNRVKFYVLCAFDRTGKYSQDFWESDLILTCRRLALLHKFDCLGYVMRFKKFLESPLRVIYNNIAAYANQPRIFYKIPFLEAVRRRSKFIHPFVYQLQNILDSEA